jgi:hypothetical protein
LPLSLPLFVFAVILSAAKDPGTVHLTNTARTFPPKNRILVVALAVAVAFE